MLVPFRRLIPSYHHKDIILILPQGHIVGNFEISHTYLKLIESQKFSFDNLKPYSALGNMVSQSDTPFSVLAVKDVLIFRMLNDIFPNDSFSFLISNFIFWSLARPPQIPFVELWWDLIVLLLFSVSCWIDLNLFVKILNC